MDYQKTLADAIVKNYHEVEYSYPYYDRRMYLDMNGVLTSRGDMTDILFIQYTINEEANTEYFELFISSSDDMAQDFVRIEDLTDEEKKAVIPMLLEQTSAR